MAFKRKADSSQGEQFKFSAIGDSITGVYLGSHDFEGDYGPTKKHLFKTDSGIKVIFGKKQLTELLAGEKTGQLMRVTYDSDKKMAKGRAPLQLYTVDIDDEYQASEDEVTEAVAAAEEGEDYDAEDEAEVETAPVKAKPRAAAPDASRQAAVQALLNRGKKNATA